MEPEEAPGWRDMYRDNPYYFNAETAQIPGLEPIDVPARLRRGAGGAERHGTTHYTAWKYLLRHTGEPGIRLVHGRHDAGNAGEPVEQAWVELGGGITFDASTKQFYDTEAFRAAVRAVETHAYPAAEAARLMLKAGHPGPWSDAERLALERP
ncbi:MAG: hypothetical protein M3457_15920 [Chloroflexota bacterium]|nr:hypothetical protein [Chloroflexota bacterium]